ncbi:hypothetical protein ACFX14_009301 [Malus domestica]
MHWPPMLAPLSGTIAPSSGSHGGMCHKKSRTSFFMNYGITISSPTSMPIKCSTSTTFTPVGSFNRRATSTSIQSYMTVRRLL